MSTYEERIANRDARMLAENPKKQWEAAFKRQEELEYDFNFMALLSGISSTHAILQTELPPKAQACKDALDELWNENYRRVEENDFNLDYSGFGSKPYTYKEVRAETENMGSSSSSL